jgi:hypothetical protein
VALRIKEKELKRPFRIPLNVKNIPVISVAGIFITFVLLGYTIYTLI